MSMSVHPHVKLQEFSLNCVLGNFTKMYQYISYFVKMWQQCLILAWRLTYAFANI
jgi:hypothetical protein